MFLNRDCCVDDHGEVDVDFFWGTVRKNQHKWKPALIYEKTVHLHDEYDSVFILGVDPLNRFEFSARIEVRSMNKYMHLDGESLFNLLECVSKRFRENAVFSNESNRAVTIQWIDHQLYKVTINDETHIKISLNALLTLRLKKRLIQTHINLIDCANYRRLFFCLLSHISLEASEKFILGALNTQTKSKTNFFEEICKSNCSGLDMSFNVEMSLNHSDWVISCIPIFIKALLQNA